MIMYRSSDGEPISSDRKNWSLPHQSVAVDMSIGMVCFTEVPAVTHTLSHHDKFVLDSQPHIVRSNKRALIMQSLQGKKSITLPSAVTNLPQTLVVHPSHEWIVLGEGTNLHLLAGRDHKFR
jgi:hypothetical protein